MSTSPSLKVARVDLFVRTSTSTTLQVEFKSGIAPKPATPEQTLCHAIEEMTRLLCIAGHEAEARAAVEGAAMRVREWKREQPK